MSRGVTGFPPTPGGWLVTVARRRIADAAAAGVRGATRSEAHLTLIAEELEEARMSRPRRALPEPYRLGLMFVCTHPAIDQGVGRRR